MALLFVKTEENEFKPVTVQSGSVIHSERFLQEAPSASVESIYETMAKMQNKDIRKTLSLLNCKFTGKPNKKEMTELVIKNLTKLEERASTRPAPSGYGSSAPAGAEPVSEEQEASTFYVLVQDQNERDVDELPAMPAGTTLGELASRFGDSDPVFVLKIDVGSEGEQEDAEAEVQREATPETWTTRDQQTLDFLTAMSGNGINVDGDVRQMLEEKKKRCEAMASASASKIEDEEQEEDAISNISDYIEFCVDEDENDGEQVGAVVDVKEVKENRTLCHIRLTNTVLVEELKVMISDALCFKATSQFHLPPEAFFLVQDGKKCRDDAEFHLAPNCWSGHVTVHLVLQLKGGGKNVMSSIYKDTKKTKQEILKDASQKLMQKVCEKQYSASALSDGQNLIKYLNQIAERDVEQAQLFFSRVVTNMKKENTPEVEKCLEILVSEGKQFGGTEQKLEKITKEVFLKPLMDRLDAQTQEINEMKHSIITMVVRIYGNWVFKGGRFNNFPFEQLLKNHRDGLKDEKADDVAMVDLAEMMGKAQI